MTLYCWIYPLSGTLHNYTLTMYYPCEKLRADGPVDVDHFRTLLVENSSERNEERLMNSWFPQVTALFSGDKALISGPQKPRFYDCVSTLIANQVSYSHL